MLRKSDRLEVILYTRDVMEWISSSWGQGVKRAGTVESFSESLLKTRAARYQIVLWWIEASKKYNFKLSVHNYTKRRDNLIEDFFNLIFEKNACIDKIKMPPTKIVNRSMTYSEYEFLRVINSWDKKLGSKISDSLVNELPSIESSRLKTDLQTFKSLKAHCEPFIDSINNYVSEEDRLEFGAEEVFVGSVPEQYSFSKKQRELIADQLAAYYSPLEMKKGTVEALRDIALRIARGEELGLNDALTLMKQAQQLRPEGPVINKKVEEWTNKLDSQS